MTLAPTTELEAVNQILAAIGESPVNRLDNSGLGDVATARQALHTESRRLQKTGWTWNTDPRLLLNPDATGTLALPLNTLKVDTVDESEDMDLVQRGQRLYDRVRSSYTFKAPVRVALVSFLAFEDMPETARDYVLTAAALNFQADFVGSETLYKFTQVGMARAWQELISDELENADYNILTTGAPARVLAR